MQIAKSERLTVLSDTEQKALYGLPDFDDAQWLEYLALTETELALASSRPGLHAQVYCLLQIGYFKVKHAFFRFDWSEVEADCAFVLSRYFHGEAFECKLITKHEHYNSAILSHLLTKCEASGNAKAVALITKISPAAWRHILLNGHDTFNSGGKMIDLDVLLAGLNLG